MQYRGNISLIIKKTFSRNSEAIASELRENVGEMYPDGRRELRR